MTNARTIEATYTRKALDRTRRGTCPCCLKEHNATKGGGMTRHGWKETGRRAGSYGNGYQWGACWGGGLRPLEETDRSGLYVVAKMDASELELEGKLAYHKAGESDHYAFEIVVRTFDGSGPLLIEKLQESVTMYPMPSRDKRGNKVTIYDVVVPRGFKGVTVKMTYQGTPVEKVAKVAAFTKGWTSRRSVSVPPYEELRQREIGNIERAIQNLKDQRAWILSAIAHHKDNPSWGVPHGAKKCVHLAKVRSYKRRGMGNDGAIRERVVREEHLACSRFKTPADVAHSTEIREEVTCSRCLKSIRAKRAKRAS